MTRQKRTGRSAWPPSSSLNTPQQSPVSTSLPAQRWIRLERNRARKKKIQGKTYFGFGGFRGWRRGFLDTKSIHLDLFAFFDMQTSAKKKLKVRPKWRIFSYAQTKNNERCHQRQLSRWFYVCSLVFNMVASLSAFILLPYSTWYLYRLVLLRLFLTLQPDTKIIRPLRGPVGLIFFFFLASPALFKFSIFMT